MSKGTKPKPISYRELREKLWKFGVSDAQSSSPGKTRTLASGLSMGVGTPNAKFYSIAYKGENVAVHPLVLDAVMQYFDIDPADFAAAKPDPEATRAAMDSDSARSASEAM